MTKGPSKLFYKIGEVCEIFGLEPHVLRYWEMEFPGLCPHKNRAGQRIYRQRDLDLIETIRELLHEQGYTIAGARRLLQGGRAGKELPLFKTSKQAAKRAALHEIGRELQEILRILDK